MGQKINPTIFRLGFNKIWKTEFFEKKNKELPLYIFKDLEIKNYFERFLKIHGIILNDYRQHYNGSTLNLYISYFVVPNFLLTKIKKEIIIKDSNNRTKIVKNFYNDKKQSILFNKNDLVKKFLRPYEIKQYLNLASNAQCLQKKDCPKFLKFKGIFEVLNLFTNNRLNVIVNFCCLNKDLYFFKATQKKMLISLQKFKNTIFFNESIELLFHIPYSLNSANLLAEFIIFQLKKTKRHKFFLSFLNQALIILLNSNLCKIRGIKIIVKGRLDGVPRAKQKTILIGDVPVQTISAKIDYIQTSTHNSNGSYGVKIWVIEKK